MASLHRDPSRRSRRARKALRFVVASALLAALALAALRASATVSSPRATALTESQLGGLWLPATRQGDSACRRYRHAARSGGNRRRWTVGGVAIHRDRLQTLFNYGEGDQIAVWDMAMQAPGVSRVQSSTTIDGEDRAPSTVSLKRVRDLLDC